MKTLVLMMMYARIEGAEFIWCHRRVRHSIPLHGEHKSIPLMSLTFVCRHRLVENTIKHSNGTREGRIKMVQLIHLGSFRIIDEGKLSPHKIKEPKDTPTIISIRSTLYHMQRLFEVLSNFSHLMERFSLIESEELFYLVEGEMICSILKINLVKHLANFGYA